MQSALSLDEYRTLGESVIAKPALEKVEHFRAVIRKAMNAGSRPRVPRVNAMFDPVEYGQQVRCFGLV